MPLTINEENAHQEFTCNQLQEIEIPTGKTIQCILATADYLNEEFNGTSKTLLETINFEQNVTYHVENLNDTEYFIFNSDDYCVIVIVTPDTKENLQPLCEKIKNSQLIPASPDDEDKIAGIFGCEKEQFHFVENTTQLRETGASKANEYFPESSFGRDETMTFSTFINMASLPIFVNEASKAGPLENALGEMASNLFGGPPPEQAAPAEQQDANPLDVLNQASGLIPQQEGGEAAPEPEGGEAAPEPAPEGGEAAPEPAAEPAPEGGEPAAEPAPAGGEAAAEPAAEGGEPAPEGGEPPVEEKSVPEGGEPAPEGGEAAAEPAPEGGEPAAEGGEPAAEGGEPAAEGGEPAPEGGEPAEEGGEPAAEGGETAPEGGEPAAEGGETAPEGGEPAEEGGETAPEGGEPAPEEGEAAAEPAPEGGEPAAEGGETAPEGGEPAAEGGEDENVLEKLAKGTSGLFNGEDNNEDGEKAEKEIENATEDREQQSETTADFSKTAAGILDGILVQQPEEGENAEGHGEEPPVNELETPEIVAEEEEEHQEENKLEENLNVLDNLFGDQNPDEIAREYVYDEDPLSIPEGLDVHERYLLNHVTELQILSTQEEHIRCLYSATKDANVFYNYCKYLKLGPVTTFHFSSNPTDTGIDKFFSFCTGRELIALVNPTPQQIEIAIRSLNNSYVIPCSIEDKEELRTYENVPPIKRYASKAMVNFVNEQIIKQKEALGLDYAHESPSTYSSFLSICIDTYLGYLASYSSDECERDLKPGHEYTYEHVKCSIFDRDFDTSDLLGINNVREIELAPNHFVKCVFSATEDNVLEKYLSFIHFGRAISYHFSTSPNGRVNYFSLCSGRDLIVFVNPAQEQLNMVIDKIKSSYAIPCGTNDKDQLFFYDYLNNVKNISPDSDIPQIHEEINQVRSLGYPRELVYDVASSYEKFLYIAYTTFLGYYIRSQFFEPVAHPIEFKRYNIKDFISLRGLDYGKTLALNWGEGKVYILKKYRDDFKFNQALYLYKTKRMSCIVPFFGEIREDENYLVFGLGARGTLKEAVSKEHLDITTCKRITIELAFALAYLNMTGTKPCSVNPDHVSVCWDYHVHLTDYDETERVINCTPEQMDALNLGSVLYTLVTGEKTSSISSKSIPSTFGPISRIFEFCKKPDVTACDVVSEILTDKGFLQESDLIDRLLRELPNDYSTISVTDSWQIDYFRTDCTNVNDSILNSIKILRFGPVTSFHFIENKDEQSEETKRTFVYESNDTCGTITNIQPKVANIITSKMRNTTIVPVNDKDLDTLFEYYNFDLIQNFARNPQLSVFREDSQKAYDNFNTFKDKDLTQETLALSYAINHQPKPIEEEESEQQPPQFPQVSLLNPRFNLQTPMPSDEVKEIEVFTDFVVKCLYSTGEDYTYNEFVKAFGDDKFTTVHFSTDENTNEEYVSFCTSKRLLLLPASKNNENNEKQVNNQVNKTINHVKAIKVIGIGSDDRSSLFGFTNFDNIQKFATTTEMDQLKEKVETSKQELLPNDLSFNDTMTYSSYFKHAGDAVTGYYVLVNPNYVPPNPLERTIDQSIDFFGQSFDKVNESQNNPPSILVDESDEKKAFDLYMKAAERDDPAALFNLGLMYSRGQGVEKDKTKAAEYYEKAAARGNPKAQFNLGLMYAKGEGVPEDKAKAAQLYEQAANQGNAKAQSNLGLMYSRGDGVEQNYDKAVELYEKAAAQNDADAQLNLGLMYDQGEGVPVDKEKAVDLYTKSAQNGNAKAQFNLGVMYHKGEEGVIEKDNKKAVELYSMAAAKGVAQAQFNLGVLYSKGDVDVPQDKERAVQLFQMAADQGDADAQLNLGAMYAKGEGVEKDKNKTVELYTKAAEQNNPKAQFNLGVMYSKGDGVEKNPAEAAKYYQQAADQNIPQALFNLGVLYFKGAEGVPEDKAKAAELFEKAAELNPKNTKALFNLAVMYQKGEGVEKDEAKALELYERAAELNNRDALLNLGVMYGEGSGGVDQDKELALDYYKRAADLGNAKAQLNLGLMYQRGDGCEVDKQKAKEYFQKAADQGNQQAQLNLGLLLLGGDDNEQDKAEELLQQAAENGNVDAMIGLARRYQQDDDIPNAIKWYSEAANQGNPQAQLELGKIFLNGEGENVDYDKAETFLQAAADGGVNEALLYLGELYEKQEEPEKAKQFYIQARSLNVEGAAEKLKDNDSASEAFADRQPPSNEEKNEDDQQHESDHKQENQPEDDEKADNESNGEPIIQEEEEAKSEKQEQEPEQEKESEPEQEKEPEPEQESTQEPEQEKEPEPEPERDEIDLLYESLENRIKALHDISNEPYNDIDSALSEINDLFISRGLTECLNTYNKANTALRTTEDDAESLINEVKESINNSSLPSLRRDSKGHISMNLPNGFLPLEGFESSNSLSSTTVYSDDEELSRMKSEVRTLESQIDQINQRIEYSRSAPSTTTQTKPRVTAPRSTGSALSSGRNSGSNSGTEFVSLVVEPDTPRRAPAKKIYQPTETPNSTTSPRSCPSPRTARNKIKNLMSKAENGDAKAQYSLGACYALGEGVAQDKKKALEYYLLAAEQGDRNAQFAAAACYSYGKGTEQDKNRAFELYLQAAIQGHDKAQFAVGHFYEYGQGGVEQDHDKAVEWYRKAAAQGHQAAIDVLRSESEEGPANLRDYSEEDLP